MTLDAVVVGGGFAGLSAATALAASGRRVVVFEARPTLGGRASAFTDPRTSERVDNGQHVLVGGYDETFRFLRRIGTEQDVYLQPTLSLDIVDAAGRSSRLRCPRLPAPLHLLGGLARWEALGWGDRAAALRLARGVSRQARASETVREWLRRNGQTSRLIELLWEPLAVAALNQAIDTASAGPFAAVVERMFTVRRRDSSLGLPRKPIDELYATPARAFIEARGGSVCVSAPARIHVSPQLAAAVRGAQTPAPVVICAVPWFALGDVFMDPPASLHELLAAAARTPASPIVTVNLWLDRAVTGNPFVGLPGRAMQWVFDKRTLFGESSSHLSLVSSAADRIVGQSNEQLIDLAVAEITSALPAARAAVVRRAVVVRERKATFSLAPGMPARPATRTAVPGLFLAGDWIDTGLPATIESAVVSGHRAAAAALEYLERLPHPSR